MHAVLFRLGYTKMQRDAAIGGITSAILKYDIWSIEDMQNHQHTMYYLSK